MRFFAELNAFSWLFDHRNRTSSLVKSLNGKTVSDKLWQNLLKYWHMPRKRCTPDLSVGVGISVIAVTLAGSGSTPLSVSLCPMKVTEWDLNCDFFAESRRSWLLHFSNRLVRFLSWSMSASSFEKNVHVYGHFEKQKVYCTEQTRDIKLN